MTVLKNVMRCRLAVKFGLWSFRKRSTMKKMVLIARQIAKQIENEMNYPGQVKINLIRESRVVDYAK